MVVVVMVMAGRGTIISGGRISIISNGDSVTSNGERVIL